MIAEQDAVAPFKAGDGDLRQEVERLRAENKRLLMECEILLIAAQRAKVFQPL